MVLGERLSLPLSDMEILRKGALVHDIGKICVPDAVLNKADSLTDEEYATIKLHPMQGVKIVEPLESLKDVIPLIRWHHERLDGSGYPDGLKGDAIPMLVRLLSVVDCYDALSSRRPYRAPLEHEECLRVLRADADNGKLDAAMVESLGAMTLPSFHLKASDEDSVERPEKVLEMAFV